MIRVDHGRGFRKYPDHQSIVRDGRCNTGARRERGGGENPGGAGRRSGGRGREGEGGREEERGREREREREREGERERERERERGREKERGSAVACILILLRAAARVFKMLRGRRACGKQER